MTTCILAGQKSRLGVLGGSNSFRLCCPALLNRFGQFTLFCMQGVEPALAACRKTGPIADFDDLWLGKFCVQVGPQRVIS